MSASPETEIMFKKMAESFCVDVENIEGYEYNSQIADLLIGKLNMYKDVFCDADYNDKEDIETVAASIEDFLNIDFKDIPGLNIGDDILATGDIVIAIINRERTKYMLQNLRNNIQLRGTLGKLIVTRLPSTEEIENILNHRPNRIISESPIVFDPLGLAFAIDDTYFSTPDGTTQSIPLDFSVLVPANNPNLLLYRGATSV